MVSYSLKPVYALYVAGIIAGIAVLLYLTGSFGSSGPSGTGSFPVAVNQKACRSNSECVLVWRGCCECDGMVAINKKFEAAWRNRSISACGLVTKCELEYCRLPTHAACLQNACTAFSGSTVFTD